MGGQRLRLCLMFAIVAATTTAADAPKNASRPAPPQSAPVRHLHQEMRTRTSALTDLGKALADIPIAFVEMFKDITLGIEKIVTGFFRSLINGA